MALDRIGYEYVHVCVDDATRLAYVEVLADERATTAIGFLRRAHVWYHRHGVRIQRVTSTRRSTTPTSGCSWTSASNTSPKAPDSGQPLPLARPRDRLVGLPARANPLAEPDGRLWPRPGGDQASDRPRRLPAGTAATPAASSRSAALDRLAPRRTNARMTTNPLPLTIVAHTPRLDPAERARLQRRARLLAWGGNAWHVAEFAIAPAQGRRRIDRARRVRRRLVHRGARRIVVWLFTVGACTPRRPSGARNR